MSKKITILDYGMCNLLNVARALEHVGVKVTITESPAEAAHADRLVVPGVGAFKDSLAEVQRRGFDDLIRNFVQTERPFLGICVGMQMLFDASEEFGEHKGLGIFPGKVQGIPSQHIPRKHRIGWLTACMADTVFAPRYNAAMSWPRSFILSEVQSLV